MEIIEIPKDINRLCRTCMTIIKDEDEKNFLASQDNEPTDLCKMLTYLIGVKVNPGDDSLPRLICNECVKQLQLSYLFKEQCESSYFNLHKFIFSESERAGKASNEKDLDLSEFMCEICSQTCPTQYRLSKHSIYHHKEENLLQRFFKVPALKFIPTQSTVTSDTTSLIMERKDIGVASEMAIDTDAVYKQEVNDVMEIEDVSIELEKTAKATEVIKMCDLCDRIFSTDLALSLHFVNHALLVESDTDPNIFEQYLFCYNCGQAFDKKIELEAHLTDCKPDQVAQYDCIKCNLVFESELLLLKHEKESVDHNGEIFWDDFLSKSVTKYTYCCPICSETFFNKNELYLHSVKHVLKNVKCRRCSKMFCSSIAYNDHLKSHPNYKHVCNECGKCLGSKHALKTHIMGIHSSVKNYICSVCSKGFKTPGRLYIHKLTHREEKKLVCSYCAYRTNNIGDFKVHNRIHTSERPYKCNFVNCTRQFKTSSHLNEHIHRHLQIKKFQCDTCQMVFGHGHTLKMHLMVHTGEKPFSCTICNAKFRRKHHLKNHMKQHAGVD